MKLEEAIKCLSDYKMESSFAATPEFEAALALGIEALKHVKAVRVFSGAEKPPLLPGETQE